jgi:hypothetical protein
MQRLGWILMATACASGACTWIPAEDVTTSGGPVPDPTGFPFDPGVVAPPEKPPDPAGLEIRSFEPARAGRLNRIEVAGASPGAALGVWISRSTSWDEVDGCPGLQVSPPADLGGCLTEPAPPAANDGQVELCAPSDLAGETVEYRVVEPDRCLQSAILTVTFPTRVELTTADASTVLSPESPGDFAGDSVSMGDVDGDGLADVLVGAPGYGNGTRVYQGRAYLLYGPLGGDLDLADADVRLDGRTSDDVAGEGLAIVGNVDGLGGDEIVVGAPFYDGAGTRRGEVYLVSAPPPGALELSAFPMFTGEVDTDATGFAVAGAGDMDGDGLSDIIVGAPQLPYGAGKVYVFRGNTDLSQVLADPVARLHGRADGDNAGYSVAGPGDTDGDGLADVLVGAPYDATRGTWAGAAFLVLGGPMSGDLSLDDADGIFLGEDVENTAGWAVGGGGDVDGDGLADLLVGADWNSAAGERAGAAYLVLGRPVPEPGILSDADARLTGEEPHDRAGGSVASAGDLDGDGYGDLLIGATGVQTAATAVGALHLVYGPVWGGASLADADLRLVGTMSQSRVGWVVAGGGDTDGDGVDDVLIGTASSGAYLLQGATLAGQ